VRQAARSSARNATAALAERNALGVERRQPLRHAGESFGYAKQGHVGSAAESAGAAAGLLDQPDAGEGHGTVDGLHHVVDGEAGNRDRGQRLHLHARLRLDFAVASTLMPAGSRDGAKSTVT